MFIKKLMKRTLDRKALPVCFWIFIFTFITNEWFSMKFCIGVYATVLSVWGGPESLGIFVSSP
jgi:hypothetical protein